ncbi:hypothetical protein FH972_004866 [Carpinus fangiana]|uniref:Uncharacterized protein n=1 Tax=Carpinus fangiana TaxID=176857 RepID=A0A5N6QMJ2_9ROSI|nr:hypothetical protein FH972_004866 [Carpinus fangiana]
MLPLLLSPFGFLLKHHHHHHHHHMEGAAAAAAALAGGKKRKICIEDEQEEDDEEQKIEQFFAIIRNIREARERLKNDSDAKKKKQKVVVEEGIMKQIQVWKPTFELGDFVEEEAQFKSIVGSSQEGDDQGSKKDQEGKEELDLKLSL